MIGWWLVLAGLWQIRPGQCLYNQHPISGPPTVVTLLNTTFLPCHHWLAMAPLVTRLVPCPQPPDTQLRPGSCCYKLFLIISAHSDTGYWSLGLALLGNFSRGQEKNLTRYSSISYGRWYLDTTFVSFCQKQSAAELGNAGMSWSAVGSQSVLKLLMVSLAHN